MHHTKLYKIIQKPKIGKIRETMPTPHLNALRYQLERLQREHPKDVFEIVDTEGKPLQMIDTIAADLAHPVAKAKRKKAAKEEEIKQDVKKRLARCS